MPGLRGRPVLVDERAFPVDAPIEHLRRGGMLTCTQMDRLEFSGKLARDAGRLAHSAFGQSATSMKGRHDVVTAMDGEVERFIREGDRRALSGRRDHRRGGGRRERRRARVADRPDRRHRQLRARHPALLRVDRLPRARRADGRGAARPQPRLALHGRARRRRVARRRAPRREPVRRPRRGDGRVRLVDPAQHRGLSRARGARDGRRLRDPPRRLRRARPRRRGRRAAARPTASCTSTPGTARRASCSCARRAATPTTSSPATASRRAIR